MNRDFTIDKAIKIADKRVLKYLPAYASYLLQNHLDAFVVELIKLSREEDLPILKYFVHLTETELLELGKVSNTEMLEFLSQNKLAHYIDKTTSEFINNRLPTVDKEEILAEDITLISLVRRRGFRNFLNEYAPNPQIFIKVMEEVDVFTAATEMASFNAYVSVQQSKITRINQELEGEREKLIEAQKLSEMGSFVWNFRDGNSTLTPGAIEIFGYYRPEGLLNFLAKVHPNDIEKLQLAIDKAIHYDGMFECEYTYIGAGNEKRIWSRGKVYVENGEPVSMKGTIMDITNEYKLLQRLQESEDLHKQAQALTHLGNWSWNIADNSIVWSDEMYRIYGLEPQSEVITFERFMSLVHPDEREKRMKEIQTSLHTLKADDYYLKIINPDGAVKMLKGKGEVVRDENNKPVMLNGTCQDVTREYLLNKDLQEKEQNFKQLINSAPDAVIVINKNSIITLWNPKTTEIFGWTAEEVLGKHLSETIVPERYKVAHSEGMKRFLSTGEEHILNKTLELKACTKSGTEIFISLTISETTQGGNIAFIAFLRDISQQKNIQLELQKNTKLLEYKNLELQRINQELESFNYAASHDLQEPLRKIHTYTGRIISRGKELLSPNQLSDFDRILNASSRMQNLIQDLLSFSQNTLKSQDTEPVSLNALIEEVKNTFINNIEEKHVEIVIEPLPVIKVVAFQFLQLFINLLTNAIKYQKQHTPPKIIISSRIVQGTSLTFEGIFPEIAYLEISVADNGIGFEQEYAEKIFDLFTRLHSKEKYPGTGIGLATCKKIIHNHKGYIRASGTPGEGATFYIYLPEDSIISTP